jgi:hypothetical protein
MPRKEWAEDMDGQLIRQAIEMTKLSRKVVADELGVTLGAIDKWIANGRIPVDQHRKLQNLIIKQTLLSKAEGAAHTDASTLASVSQESQNDTVSATPRPLKNVADADMLRELLFRGFKVTLALPD